MRVTSDRINSISASGRMRPALREAAANEEQKANESAGAGRALIPLSPVQAAERPYPAMRHPANFLAHLIATEQAMPQTRERRRIEPNVAAAIYAAARDTVAPADHDVFRAL